MEELEQIIDEMINAGEDDASIQSVIKLYKSKTKDEPSSKVGSKNNPIQGIPSVKDAKLGLYYKNKNTNQLYVFADNKYHEVDPAKTYDNAPVNKEGPLGTYYTQTEVDLDSVSRAADNKESQDQTVLPGYMFNQKAADEGVLFDGFKFPEANYRYKEENGKAAWSKSTDGDKTFEVVDATNIPESWSKDPQFKLALAGQKGAAIIDGVAYNNFQEYRDREGNTKDDKFSGTVFHPLQHLRSDERKDEETHVTNLEDDEENYAKAMNISASDLKKNKSFYSDLPEDRGFFADLASSWKQGYGSGRTSNESWEVFKKGDGISSEDLKALIVTNKKIEELGNTNEQAKFAKDLEKYGGGVFGTLRAFAENPGFAPQAIVSSIGTMAGSFVDSEEVWGTALASAGAGAVAGAGIGSLGFSLGPFGVLTTAGGAVTGTVSGFIGGLVGSMETGLTLTDLLKDELDGAQFNEENVIRILENKDVFDKIKARACERGITIGAFEAVTAGLSRGIASNMIRSSRKVGETGIKTGLKISTSTTALEMAGGAGGEYAGQLAQYRGEGLKSSGKKVNISDVVVEGLIEAKGVVNVADVISESLKNSEYTINSEKRTKKEIRDLVNNPNTPIESLAKINFEIKNDDEFNSFVRSKQNDAFLETQVDAKVEDIADRKRMVTLENERVQAEVDSKKKGISMVPGAKEKLENIEIEMSEIVGKYTAIDGRSSDVKARAKTAKDVLTRLDEINTESTRIASSKTTATIKKQMEALDKKTGRKGQVIEMNPDDIAESHAETVAELEAEVQGYGQKLSTLDPKSKKYKDTKSNLDFIEGQLNGISEADLSYGYIVDYTDGNYDIILNRSKPMIGTAAHEFQHKILSRTLKNDQKLQDGVGGALTKYVNDKLGGVSSSFIDRMGAYINPETGEQVGEFGEEIVTVMSESILDGSLKFNENLFTKVGDVIRQTLQRVGAIDIKFDTGRDVYNFIKDYNRSIEKDYVSKAITKMAAEGAKGKLTETATDTKAGGTKFSKFSALESINNLIPSDIKTKEDYQEFIRDRKRFAPLGKALEENGVISNYVKSKSVGDEYVDAMESVTDRVIGLRGTFNPERLREDGTKVGKEAFGEFIFANTNFAKRDAKKALAIRKIESDKTTSIDTKEAREIEDQSTIDESTSGRSDGDTKKTNVLNFTGVSSKINELMDVVDIMPVGSNTFKTVDEYTGKAAEIIFDIPAEKATKGNKNLSHKTKVVNGMMELSQAGKIQDFFRVGDNLEKLVKIMVPENVTSKTADISEVGENIDVARDIYGRSIGLKGKVLEYFFDKTEKRSQGLTTQPNVWELKPEFKKPSKETLEQLRADLGITPQGKANVSDRAFNGQLLKGVAEYQAYQTALSITQRKLDAIKQEATTKEEKSAISQDIANVTAAQSRLAFSKSLAGKIYNDSQIKHGSLSGRVFGVIGTAKITYASAKRNPDGTIRWKTKSVRDLFGWWSDNETGEQARNRVANNFLSANPQYRDILRNTMSGGETISLFKTKDKFDSAINSTNVEQSTINRFHYNKKKLLTKSALEKIRTKEFKANELAKTVVGKQFWLAVQSHLKNNPNDVWFFEEMLVDSQNNQGAITRIIALFTSYPVDKKGQPVFNREVIEEHSSPQIKMARISLAAAKDGNIDDVWPVIEASYMQMSLLASDDAKVRAAGLSSNLPDIFWKEIVPRILDGSLNWLPKGYASFSRYAVAGVDLNGYKLLSGETVTEFFGVSDIKHIDGSHNIKLQNDIILGILTGKFQLGYGQSIANVNLSKENSSNAINSSAMSFSRTANPAKGISVLDFDDTLATTKSGVRYTLPNPDHSPQPKKKVIFMAGGPGSGKSNVINQLGLKEQGFKVVNQDISLEWLMKNHGMPTDMREFTPEQASQFGKLSHEARGIALKKRIKYQGEGDGVIIDGTGASLNVMKKNIQDFKDKGYDVQMIFVETSQETALSRNKARKERSLRTGIVIKTHDSVQANKEAYRELFGERFAEVNTDNLKQGDAMPDDLSIKVNDFTSGYIKGRLNAGEYATKGEELRQQGAEFDFSEFNQVVEGRTAPLFNKAMKLQEKFTSKDMFVLTARPAESNQAIFEFLQANGLNIPIENIVGLGSSLSSDKALWMAGKVGEGYNDFYFADDILENVQAVSDMLAQFDVKSKVQQAKRDFVLGDPKVTKLLDEKSMNDVKDVDGLANPGVYSNVKFSKSHRAEYENTVAKNRPDLSGKEVTATIDKMFEYIDGLDVPNKRKYEQITTKWLATSNIKLPEDSYKIQQAVEIAELKKEDIFSYKNPNEIIEKYAGTIKVKPISPVGIKEFTRATGFNDPITTEYGIVEYEVEETREAQQKVRDIVNTHWGPNSNPWCITKIDKDGNLSEDAWRDWTSYGKGPKRIVFQNGKLLAMKANYEYWGKMNKHSEGPIIQVKEGNVTNTTELVVGDGGIVDPIIRETRTVSKDGNTVTTNIFENSQDGYADGTTIVENRIKGVKTKETRFDPDGSKVSTQEFNKKGKPTTSYQFNPNGKVKSVNGHLQQQAITEAGLDVNAREDADIDLTNELVVKVGDIIENNYTETETDGTTTDYFYGRALVGDQVMEIGFESKSNLDIADVTKTVNGKIRLDIGKVIREVDPNVKGLPKTGVKFSKGISKDFNDIIEQSTGVGSEKVFSDAQAKIRGNKRRFDNIVPYSVQDLMGLLYNFVGRGKAGEQHMEFFKKALIDPFARAINELNQSKQSSASDYSNLTKAFPNVKKKLNKEIEGGDYTYDQAIRVYLWNKAGFEVPGLSKRDLNALDSIVKNDPELQAFADTLGLISKKEEGYAKPGEYWLVENIASDLLSDGSIGDARSEFLAEWQQNADEIFSKENLNKIQAIYGNKFREALEDILYRMKNGTNRPTGSSRLTNNFMNWINNSTGAIMFFNMRSALLQTLSTTNYINWTDNNPLKAAMAFANQKQYWSDFSALFNSDFLKQRRSGNQRSINEAELTTAVANSDNKAKAAIAWLLQKGFLPTQIMDSFAISSGGATFYRNRINKYIKEGMSPEQAQEKAFLDFQEVTEATQQSARPDMISQQQASPLGRLILSFQNTPMQYARIMNKAARDIVNGRGDQKSNISKIVYYGALQSIIFAALQSAIFAALGDDEEEEFDKKKQRIVGSMVDGWLAGLGVAGKAIGTIERSIKEYLKQKERGFNADHAQTIIQLLGFSPPIGSKLRKIYSAIQTEEFNKGVSEKRGFTLDNPTWSSWGNVIEGFTNIPLGRISNKLLNIDNALDSQNQWWERAALLLGWNTWDLGIKDPDIEAVRGEIKEEKKIEQKRISQEKAIIKKEEKDKKLEKENTDKEKANLELQKKEREAGKKVICAAVSTKGDRCKKKIERGSTYCTIHDKVEQNESGKKSQCKKIKNDGKKCKVKTTNKSGYCYYHD
jgi:predicted kinase